MDKKLEEIVRNIDDILDDDNLTIDSEVADRLVLIRVKLYCIS